MTTGNDHYRFPQGPFFWCCSDLIICDIPAFLYHTLPDKHLLVRDLAGSS